MQCFRSQLHDAGYYVGLFHTEPCCLLTEPFFSPQASRQFDQEGRKKFFTLDMNNILLEWVGQLLNHRQPNPSSHSSSFYQPFSLIFSRFPRPLLPLPLSVLFSLRLSLSAVMTYYSSPFTRLSFRCHFPLFSPIHHSNLPPPSFIVLLLSSLSLSLTVLTFHQYWAAGAGAASRGAFRHLFAHGGVCAVQQRGPPQAPEEAQPQHPGERGLSVEKAVNPLT